MAVVTTDSVEAWADPSWLTSTGTERHASGAEHPEILDVHTWHKTELVAVAFRIALKCVCQHDETDGPVTFVFLDVFDYAV